MIYYLFLSVAALLFALQFIFTKAYSKINGEGVLSTLSLSFFAYVAIAVFFFIKGCITNGKLTFGFSCFTLFITLGVAVISLLCLYFGIKVLGIGNTSVYSVFMMTGSMALPCLTGLIFFREKVTVLKIAAIILMLAAAICSASGGKSGEKNKKAVFYYVAVFVLNGLIGVLFTVHQKNPALTARYIVSGGVLTADNDAFMCWYGISTAFVTAITLLIIKIKKFTTYNNKSDENVEKVTEKVAEKAAYSVKNAVLSAGIAVCYGVFNGVGNYFIAIGTGTNGLGASVTFPVVNGGCILFSTLIGAIAYKEKITLKTVAGLLLVITATVLFMFAG